MNWSQNAIQQNLISDNMLYIFTWWFCPCLGKIKGLTKNVLKLSLTVCDHWLTLRNVVWCVCVSTKVALLYIIGCCLVLQFLYFSLIQLNLPPLWDCVLRCLYACLTLCFSLCLCVCHSLSQGSEGFGSQVNKCLENAEYLYDQLQRRTDFELIFKDKVLV